MKLAVVTLLRGDQRFTDRWATFRFPAGTQIVAIAPPGHRPAVDNGATYLDAPAFSPAEKPGTMEAAQERCDHILSLYHLAFASLDPAGVDAILLFEDDIMPPDNGTDLLIAALRDASEQVAGVVSVYPLHGDPETACLMPGEWGLPPKIADLPTGHFPVWGGGSGFSIYRAPALLSCLPIRRLGPSIDWDPTIATAFASRGLSLLCHGGVRCQHG